MKDLKLRIAHYPQVPCEPYIVNTDNIGEALKIKDVLCYYDIFQYENKIKPDYCNVSIIQGYDEQYKEWYDLDDYEIEELIEGAKYN